MFERRIFSARLKALIQQRNMTYAQLAGILGVSTAQVSDMANGKAALLWSGSICSVRPLRFQRITSWA